ncbi:MAG: AraC family transcriptional regulator [Devosia sp.]
MDPLSDVLSLLKPRSYSAGGFDVGRKICLQFNKHDGVKCYAISSGQGWLWVEGVAEPVQLHTGDCFVLPRGRPFRLATDLDAPPIDFMSLLKQGGSAGLRVAGEGGGFFMVGGHFSLDGPQANMLLGALPSIVHIRSEADKAALRWALERMRAELRQPAPGSALIVQQLAYLLLVQALRLHLSDGRTDSVGWLFALADRQMNEAISAMHAEPARRWTLQDLAECAGMSRTSFAVKFKATVGTAPMDYLTRWRMLLAGDRLIRAEQSTSAIAQSVGYDSESAFSTAFKRVMGCAPRQYGRRGVTATPDIAATSALLTSHAEAVAG